MKYQIVPVCCALLLAAFFGACKKAETPPPAPRGDTPTPIEPATNDTAQADSNRAAGGVLMKVKWPVGQRLVYRMDLEQNSTNHIPQMPRPMQQQISMAMTYALAAVQELPNNGRELEMEFLANEMEVRMGEQVLISFDSKETGQNQPQNPFSEPFRKMIGTKVRMHVNAAGKVEEVLNLAEWHQSLSGGAPGPAGGMLAQQFNETYFRQIVDFGSGLPSKPVEVGDTWPHELEIPAGALGKINAKSTVIFKGWETREERKCAVLDLAGTFKGSTQGGAGMPQMKIESGQALGTSWFDPDLGALVASAVDQTMRLTGDMPGAQGGNNKTPANFTVELAQKVTLNLVDVGKVQQ